MRARDLPRRLALTVVSDPNCGPDRSVLEVVRQALTAGAPSIQLRAKEASARAMAELGRALLVETRRAGALLFVNDRVDVALAIGADGAHVGNDDIPLAAARRIVPADFLLGRSVDRVEDVANAIAEGADYLGAGPVYPTGSKLDTGPVMGPGGLKAVCEAAGTVPVVGIGGIDRSNAAEVTGAGAAGVAVIAAVMRAEDPGEAVAALLREVRRGTGGA